MNPLYARRETSKAFLFGTPEFDVRWYRSTRTLVLHRAGASVADEPLLVVGGKLAEAVTATLAVLWMRRELRRGALAQMLCNGRNFAWNTEYDWYRCGRLMLRRPARQGALQ